MSEKHLEMYGDTWCDEVMTVTTNTTDDPRDATCPDCLRAAAEYGAAAAMRYAAVECGATQDPELVRERDEAIRRLNAIGNALERERVFFCTSCLALKPVHGRGMHAGGLSWCADCAPNKVSL